MADRTSNIAGYFVGLWFACAGLVTSVSPSVAQDRVLPEHPVFSNPIQESEPLPWDVQFLRVHVFLHPESHTIRGEAEIDVTFQGPALDSTLITVGEFTSVTITAIPSDSDSLDHVSVSGAADAWAFQFHRHPPVDTACTGSPVVAAAQCYFAPGGY